MNTYKSYREIIAEQERKEKQDTILCNIVGTVLAVLFIAIMFFCMSLK